MRWIIGDIHGMLHPLEALLDAIARRDPQCRLLFVGDYVNRGPDSNRVLDLVLGLTNARFIRGNHDDIFDLVLGGQCYAENASGGDPLKAFQWFMQYGLAETLASYGVDWARMEWVARHGTHQRLAELVSCVPEAHRRFIRQLPPVIEERDFFVAHGLWDPDAPDGTPTLAEPLVSDPRRRQLLLWGRYELSEVVRLKHWRRTGYFGHTCVDNYPELLHGDELLPIVTGKLVLLDTAAALRPDGRLTAFCHEGREIVQADRAGQIIVKREP